MDRTIFKLILITLAFGAFAFAQEGDSAATDLLDQLPQAKKSSFFTQAKRFFGLTGSSQREAEKAYEKEDYDLAIQQYLQAGLENPEDQGLAYNLGNAQFKKRKYEEAISSYKKALVGDDAEIASSANYNIGNSHFRKAEMELQTGNMEQALQDFRASMAHYKKSMEIRPDRKDAKQNIEVTQARIKELLDRQKDQQQQQQQQDQKPPPEPSQKAKEALAKAMQMVEQRRYADAKQVLEKIIQEDETAVSFQSYVQRIQDVMDIMDGNDPAPPQGQDPRNKQDGIGVI